MRKFLLCTVLLGICSVSLGQDKNTEATTYLKTLSDQFIEAKANLDKENKTLEEIKIKIVSNTDAQVLTDLKTHLDKTKSLQFKLDSIYTVAQTAMSFYETKEKLKNEDLKKIFPHKYQIASISKSEPKETKIYTYFGKDKVIDNDILKNKTGTEAEIFKDVLGNKGEESYLGDITIPKNGQEFYFYDNKFKISKEKFAFKKLDVEIRDGYFNDILVHVEDKDGNTHVFTNQIGVSILFYDHSGKRKFMYYKYSIKKNATTNTIDNYTDETLKNLYIKLTDIMGYSYKIGNHYIPHDLALELPNKDTDNSQSNATY